LRQVVGKKSDDQFPVLLTREGVRRTRSQETQSFQTLQLPDSGVNEAGQRPITVERVAALYFHSFSLLHTCNRMCQVNYRLGTVVTRASADPTRKSLPPALVARVTSFILSPCAHRRYTASDCKCQLSKCYILAGSGTDRMSQQANAVERFAVLRLRRFLANALQSDAVDRACGYPGLSPDEVELARFRAPN